MVSAWVPSAVQSRQCLIRMRVVQRCEDVPEYDLFAAWCPASKPASNL